MDCALGGVDVLERILLAQLLELHEHALLVFDITYVVIVVAKKVHPRFPIVKAPLLQEDARDQVLQVRLEVNESPTLDGAAPCVPITLSGIEFNLSLSHVTERIREMILDRRSTSEINSASGLDPGPVFAGRALSSPGLRLRWGSRGARANSVSRLGGGAL